MDFVNGTEKKEDVSKRLERGPILTGSVWLHENEWRALRQKEQNDYNFRTSECNDFNSDPYDLLFLKTYVSHVCHSRILNGSRNGSVAPPLFFCLSTFLALGVRCSHSVVRQKIDSTNLIWLMNDDDDEYLMTIALNVALTRSDERKECFPKIDVNIN